MVTSTKRPAKIQVLGVKESIENNKLQIRYAFNFNITEKEKEIPDYVEVFEYEEKTPPTTRTVYEYFQYIGEMEVDLMLKPILPDILKGIYKKIEPFITQRLQDAAIEIPSEISVDDTQ